jgi:hypothetical protein
MYLFETIIYRFKSTHNFDGISFNLPAMTKSDRLQLIHSSNLFLTAGLGGKSLPVKEYALPVILNIPTVKSSMFFSSVEGSVGSKTTTFPPAPESDLQAV